MHPIRPALRSITALAAAALATSPAAAARAGLPLFEGLGDLPGGAFYSYAYSLSADGSTVVGRSVSTDTPSSHEAFRWTAQAGITGLGDLGAAFMDSDAQAVSADGSVVAGEATPDAGPGVAYRWTEATGLVALADSSGQMARSQAFAISDDGAVIVGVGSQPGPNQGFRWTAPAGMTGLGWLPADIQDSFAFGTSGNGGVVCGISFSGDSFGVETFRWTPAAGLVGMGDVPGGVFYAIAWDVSADGGTICGAARTSFGNDELFVWTEAGGFTLPDAEHGASSGSSGEAVSADGSVVVGYGLGGAVMWDAAHGLRRIDDVLDDLGADLSGWELHNASGVSADGRTIAGNGRNPAGDLEAWIARLPAPTAIPEGTSLAGRATLTAAGPNPFPAGTAFRLALPPGGARVRAAILRVDGALVRVLADGALPAGPHEIRWDGAGPGGTPAAAGVYFLRVEAGPERFVRKLVPVR